MRVKFKLPWKDYQRKLRALNQTDTGQEVPNSVPVAPPVGYKKQPSMIDNIRNMVRSEHLRVAALNAGKESFQDADDFDVEDDPFPPSAYEMEEVFEPAPERIAPVAKPVTPPADPAAAAPAPADRAPAAPPSPSSAST